MSAGLGWERRGGTLTLVGHWGLQIVTGRLCAFLHQRISPGMPGRHPYYDCIDFRVEACVWVLEFLVFVDEVSWKVGFAY